MSESPDWEAAFADLGERHNIAAVTVKNHGCCGHTFAAIDAALALKAEHALRSADIARVVVHTYSTALKVAGSPTAETPFQAKFSMPYVVATALLHGSVRLDAFTPARLADPEVRDLMGRVELAVDATYDRGFPRQRAAWMEIILRDGRILTRHQTTRRGDPDDPLSDAELDAKFRELAGARLGAAAAGSLLADLHALERRGDCELLANESPGRA
jgi:2-methylcitrate dehydratase PrpD